MSRPEIFISIDVETDGAAPGVNSMLALGAAAFSAEGEELSTWYATLQPLPDAQQNADTMAWWQTQPEAWAEVTSGQRLAETAIPQFGTWCETAPGKPVAVAWPAAFDFAFVNYYLHRFYGSNPLGFACLDIRSYANGLARYRDYYGLPEKAVRAMAGKVDKTGLREHVAVDDAIEQGRLFMALRNYAAEIKGAAALTAQGGNER
jgi:DNA polymerase III alpha subunit (gram-positive type)